MIVNDTIYDTFIQKMTGLADTLDNYVSGLTNQPVSIIDILTLIAAILAVIVSGVSIYVTNKVYKKNCESNEKIAEQVQVAEDKRAHAAIDANLTANARIEWIQNVRQATAELITNCYKFIWSKQDEQQKNWEAAQEKKALFVLYFGHDGDSSEPNISRLLDGEINKGKNNLLVLFIDELFLSLEKYHCNHSFLESYRKDLQRCNSCYSYNEEIDDSPQKVYICEKDQYGTLFTEDDCNLYKIQKKEAISEYVKYESDLLSKLRNLSDIMRIYLKIEWNIAKEGK